MTYMSQSLGNTTATKSLTTVELVRVVAAVVIEVTAPPGRDAATVSAHKRFRWASSIRTNEVCFIGTVMAVVVRVTHVRQTHAAHCAKSQALH